MPFTISVLKNLEHQLQAQKSPSEEGAEDCYSIKFYESKHSSEANSACILV